MRKRKNIKLADVSPAFKYYTTTTNRIDIVDKQTFINNLVCIAFATEQHEIAVCECLYYAKSAIKWIENKTRIAKKEA